MQVVYSDTIVLVQMEQEVVTSEVCIHWYLTPLRCSHLAEVAQGSGCLSGCLAGGEARLLER